MSALRDDEPARLAALYELDILDTEAEQTYDDVVGLAAAICDMPVAIVNFVDAHRQWGKALVGLESSEAPRDASFCARTIQQADGILIVPDTRADPMWADNPQVTGDPGLRFYAGAAIVTEDGHALGSVCVADTTRPRQLSGTQIEGLRMLARQTASHLKLRRQTQQLVVANGQLRELTVTDILTGLANRTFFEQTLDLALRQRRSGHPGLLFCDMDGFKQINDRLGHHAGDQLLRAVAKRMTHCARRGDLVARLAGDEFVILCPGISEIGDLQEIAGRMSAELTEPLIIEDTRIVPSISIGAALARESEEGAGLLRRADEAMYRAKAGLTRA